MVGLLNPATWYRMNCKLFSQLTETKESPNKQKQKYPAHIKHCFFIFWEHTGEF
jgi:hypothetical protein